MERLGHDWPLPGEGILESNLQKSSVTAIQPDQPKTVLGYRNGQTVVEYVRVPEASRGMSGRKCPVLRCGSFYGEVSY